MSASLARLRSPAVGAAMSAPGSGPAWSRRRWCLAAAAAGLSLRSAGAQAHPHHSTRLTLERPPKAERAELTVQMSPEDLEAALRHAHDRPIVLEREPDRALDQLVQAYVCSKISLRPRAGEPARISWVGHELEPQAVWCYLELGPVTALVGARVTCELLFEVEPSVQHYLTIVDPAFKRTVRLTEARPSVVIRAPKP